MNFENDESETNSESHFAITYQCLSLSELQQLPEIRAYIKENFPDHQVIFEECHRDRERDRGRFWIIKQGKKEAKSFFGL